METLDKTFDRCKKCGKKIRYDREDGYWYNIVKQNGNYTWTPFNCVNENTTHEPTNHTPDDRGYYHPRKKKLKQKAMTESGRAVPKDKE